MARADRLPFAAACVLFAAGEAERAAEALAIGTPLRSIVPMLAATGWTCIAYHLWRRRSMRVDFPDGHWADIYTATEMPRRITVRMSEMIAEIPQEQNAFGYLRDLNHMRDTMLAMLVKAWDYGDPPGDSAEGLADLPEASYDKLVEETLAHRVKTGFFEEDPEKKEPEPEKKPAARKKTPAPSTSSD
jgi:hypothetical protein